MGSIFAAPWSAQSGPEKTSVENPVVLIEYSRKKKRNVAIKWGAKILLCCDAKAAFQMTTLTESLSVVDKAAGSSVNQRIRSSAAGDGKRKREREKKKWWPSCRRGRRWWRGRYYFFLSGHPIRKQNKGAKIQTETETNGIPLHKHLASIGTVILAQTDFNPLAK